MSIPREYVHRLLFGDWAGQRFTHDSPVLPDVWVWYAEHPGGAADLLLIPYRNARPGHLTERIRERMRAHDEGAGRGRRYAEVAHNQSTVAVALTFEELVRTVLPATAWWEEVFGRQRGRVLDALFSARADRAFVVRERDDATSSLTIDLGP